MTPSCPRLAGGGLCGAGGITIGSSSQGGERGTKGGVSDTETARTTAGDLGVTGTSQKSH